MCNQKFLDRFNYTMGIQDREKLKLEVELKRQWDKERPHKVFDTTYANSILQMRRDHFVPDQNNPSARLPE